MSADLPRIGSTQFPALPSNLTPESRYWRKYKSPIIVKEYAAVSHIHFSPAEPHNFVVSASTRVRIYSSKTRAVVKTISQFTDVTFGAEYRKDGSLIVSGDATGLVQVFNVDSRRALLSRNLHKLPTYVTKFSPHDLKTMMTASDDKTIRIWDIPTDKPLNTFKGHADYIRTADFMPSSPHLFLSGSYDHTMRLWDARVAERGGEIQSFDHEANVENVMTIGGTTVVSAGGPDVRVWDLSSGTQRPLKVMQNHAKGVSCVAKSVSRGRMLSGGLDGHLKIYDTSDWKVLHSVKYPHPILSVAVSPDEKHLVVGMSNGLLSVRTRDRKLKTIDADLDASERPKTQRFLRGANYRPLASETIVARDVSKGLKKWDKCLRRYAYSDALDAVLKCPEAQTIHAVLRELKRRSGLSQALSHRDDTSLIPIMRFLVTHVKDDRMTPVCTDVCMVILELYGGALGASPTTSVLLARLEEQVSVMIKRAKESAMLEGMLQMLFVSS